MQRLAAILLSLATPGAGHAFLGRPRRGAVFLAAAFLAIASMPWTRMLGFAAVLAVALVAVGDAARLRRAGASELTWAIFLGVGFVGWFLTRIFYLEAFRIASGGDLPTLQVGDHVMVSRWRTSPARGDLIVFLSPEDPRATFVKRVVALGGDSVEVRQGTLLVNDRAATAGEATPCSFWDNREDAGRWSEVRASCVPETLDGNLWTVAHVEGAMPRDLERTTVPRGTVFVMGDNRENSHDSRFWGPVPAGNITGTVLFVWWSSGAPEGVRWGRIGKTP